MSGALLRGSRRLWQLLLEMGEVGKNLPIGPEDIAILQRQRGIMRSAMARGPEAESLQDDIIKRAFKVHQKRTPGTGVPLLPRGQTWKPKVIPIKAGRVVSLEDLRRPEQLRVPKAGEIKRAIGGKLSKGSERKDDVMTVRREVKRIVFEGGTTPVKKVKDYSKRLREEADLMDADVEWYKGLHDIDAPDIPGDVLHGPPVSKLGAEPKSLEEPWGQWRKNRPVFEEQDPPYIRNTEDLAEGLLTQHKQPSPRPQSESFRQETMPPPGTPTEKKAHLTVQGSRKQVLDDVATLSAELRHKYVTDIPKHEAKYYVQKLEAEAKALRDEADAVDAAGGLHNYIAKYIKPGMKRKLYTRMESIGEGDAHLRKNYPEPWWAGGWEDVNKTRIAMKESGGGAYELEKLEDYRAGKGRGKKVIQVMMKKDPDVEAYSGVGRKTKKITLGESSVPLTPSRKYSPEEAGELMREQKEKINRAIDTLRMEKHGAAKWLQEVYDEQIQTLLKELEKYG